MISNYLVYQLLLLSLLLCNTISLFNHIKYNKITKLRCVESKETFNINNEFKQLNDTITINENDVQSKEINKLLSKINDTKKSIEDIKLSITNEENIFNQLDEEYGSEINRIKKEFSRIKERSYEEANELTNKAKVDAIKEILPITDNYFRAKQIYVPSLNDNEEKILGIYDNIFNQLTKLLQEFGVTRVESIGKPFDFNFMEAIMTAPSTEFVKDTVVMEYQVGYRMGDKCVRPAMVVVSEGPGPSSN